MRIFDNDGDVHQSVVAIRGIWRPKGAIWGQRGSRGQLCHYVNLIFKFPLHKFLLNVDVLLCQYKAMSGYFYVMILLCHYVSMSLCF
jgi:hypothetical protein